jgi:hypothetical protein
VVIPDAPKVRAEVLAVPIWTTPLVVVPVPPCSTRLPPVEVEPVWFEPLKVKEEPVPEPVVESPGAKTNALDVPAAVVVMSLVWAPAKVTAPPDARLKLDVVTVRALAPRVKVDGEAPVKFKAPEELTVTTPEPEPMLEVPVDESVVKAPEAAVVAPI